MEENDNNRNKVPSKMARLAWPKSRYGVYLAIFCPLYTSDAADE